MKNSPCIKDYMATTLFTLKATASIYDAVDFLLKNKISGAPVVDGKNKLIGLISEKDCLRLMTKGVQHNEPKVNVADFMTTKVDTITPEMDIYYAAGIFLKNAYRRFPVVDKQGKMVGQISRRDILRAIKENIKSDRFRVKTSDKAKLIQKEDIVNLRFPKMEVLKTADERKIRAIKLQNAMRLGNIEHYKVKLVFEDNEDLRMVNTTVWSTTDKNVSLKGGITLPINRIHEVNIL